MSTIQTLFQAVVKNKNTVRRWVDFFVLTIQTHGCIWVNRFFFIYSFVKDSLFRPDIKVLPLTQLNDRRITSEKPYLKKSKLQNSDSASFMLTSEFVYSLLAILFNIWVRLNPYPSWFSSNINRLPFIECTLVKSYDYLVTRIILLHPPAKANQRPLSRLKYLAYIGTLNKGYKSFKYLISDVRTYWIALPILYVYYYMNRKYYSKSEINQ